MRDYWSCSKFADWIRGTPKPYAGTSEEWSAWRKIAKTKKVRYWLAEEALDFLEDLVFWPLKCTRNACYYFSNRWISKTHALTSALRRGQWYDFDSRILNSLFDELVNHVEVEQAWMQVVFSKDECKKYRTPWYRKFLRLRLWRCPEAGWAHLEWAAGLKYDDEWIDKSDPSYGQPTPQALAAQQTMQLYKWWKEERPKRPDPMDTSGWSNFCEERRHAAEAQGEDDLSWLGRDEDESDKERSSKILEICYRMEQEQDDEDTEMLIRLIRIRHSLWT